MATAYLTQTIYLIFVNADSTEGRGPMVLHTEAGFFTSKEEALMYLSELPGVMGIKGASGGSEIRVLNKHDPELEEKKKKLISQIETHKATYRQLTGKNYPH